MLALVGMVYIFFPMLSIPLILVAIFLDKRNTKIYLFGLVLNLALVGYYFKPDASKDLYRHFITIQKLSSTGDIFFDPLIVKNLWFYFVGLVNNYSLLPFSAIIITYYLISRDLYDFGKREAVSHCLVVSMIILMIIMWPIIWPMSGVRFPVMLAFFFHGFYREFVQGKKDWATYLFYLLACFLHYAFIPLLMMRLAISVFKKKIIMFFLVLMWPLYLNLFVYIIGKINSLYINELISKISNYDGFTRDSSYSIFTAAIFVLYGLMLIISYVVINKKYNSIYIKYEKFFDFGLLVAAFSLGSIFYSELVINRFGYMEMIFLLLMLMILLSHDKSKFLNSLYWLYLPEIIVLGIYLQYVKLKSTNYDLTLNELLFKNILILLIKY